MERERNTLYFHNENDEEDNEKENAPAKKSGGFFRSFGIIIVFAILTVLIIGTLVIVSVRRKNGDVFNDTPAVSFIQYETSFENVSAVVLDDMYVILTENAVTGITSSGTWKWSNEGNFKNAELNLCGNYALISVPGENVLNLTDKDGNLKRISLEGNAVFTETSGNCCIVCELLENTEYSISFYDMSREEPLIFRRKYSTIYPLSAAISENSGFMCVSGIGKETYISSVNSFIKIKDGEVYATLTEDGEYYPLVETAGGNVFAANGDRLIMMRRIPSATYTGNDKEVLFERNGESEYIVSMASDGKNICVLRKDGKLSSNGGILQFYDGSGNLLKTDRISENAEKVVSASGYFMVCGEETVLLYGSQGKSLGKYDESSQIKYAIQTSGKKTVIITDAGIKTLDFSKRR